MPARYRRQVLAGTTALLVMLVIVALLLALRQDPAFCSSWRFCACSPGSGPPLRFAGSEPTHDPGAAPTVGAVRGDWTDAGVCDEQLPLIQLPVNACPPQRAVIIRGSRTLTPEGMGRERVAPVTILSLPAIVRYPGGIMAVP